MAEPTEPELYHGPVVQDLCGRVRVVHRVLNSHSVGISHLSTVLVHLATVLVLSIVFVHLSIVLVHLSALLVHLLALLVHLSKVFGTFVNYLVHSSVSAYLLTVVV